MTTTKHTQGPWKIENWKIGELKTDQTTIVSKSDPIAIVENLWIQPDRVLEQEANAQLIASAPELLEACKYALDILERIGKPKITQGGYCEEQDYDTSVRELKNSISKAEGE